MACPRSIARALDYEVFLVSRIQEE
jgi:hypothetical protein